MRITQAAEKVSKGYSRLQLKAGGRPVEDDIAAVKAVWERIGERARLAVDGNRGLTGQGVLRLSRECRDVPFVLEQPCSTLQENLAVRERLRHPLYLESPPRTCQLPWTRSARSCATGSV